jgi:hypothetical protein
MEWVRSIDGLAHNESFDLLREGIYLHLQLNVFLHLIDASLLLDSSRFIPTAWKIPLLGIVGQLTQGPICLLSRQTQKCASIHWLDHATVGLSQSLVEKLHESQLLISMWRALNQHILKSLPTLKKFLILLLSKWTYFLPTLIDFGHGEKFIVKLVQQVFPRCDGPRHVWIQPCLGSIMEWEMK